MDNLRINKIDYKIIDNGVGCYPWREYFAILPRKTISGTHIFWIKALNRKVEVWVVCSSGFHMEHETQYASAFDLLTYEDPTN